MVAAFRNAVDFVHRSAQGRRIDIAHDLADVLHLPSLCFVLGDALRLEQGIAQAFRHLDFRQAFLRQLDQLGAEILQGRHLALALGFAGA
jgi:hypothetical protein